MHVDDAAERAQRQVGRPSMVAIFRKPILEILQHTPDLASLEILRRVRETGYEGGKTALYALVASIHRPADNCPFVDDGSVKNFSRLSACIRFRDGN